LNTYNVNGVLMASKLHKLDESHVIDIYLHWHHMTLICSITREFKKCNIWKKIVFWT
jgi:hypothetical protein